MLVDLAAPRGARPTGNSSKRNQTIEDELGISSGRLTLRVLLEGPRRDTTFSQSTPELETS